MGQQVEPALVNAERITRNFNYGGTISGKSAVSHLGHSQTWLVERPDIRTQFILILQNRDFKTLGMK